MNLKEIEKSSLLLKQALSLLKKTNNSKIVEACNHIHFALTRVNSVTEKQNNKSKSNTSQYEQWWSNVQSGVTNQPMSKEACQKSLKELNKMIAKEQEEIDSIHNLEAKINKDELLNE